jgi:hypothetical protein
VDGRAAQDGTTPGAGDRAVDARAATDAQLRSLLVVRASMLNSLGAAVDPAGTDLRQLESLPDGSVAASLAQTIREADPAARARVLTGFLVDVQHLIDLLSSVRNDAIRELRSTKRASYDDVAMLLGISKSRAQQLCKRLESGS